MPYQPGVKPSFRPLGSGRTLNLRYPAGGTQASGGFPPSKASSRIRAQDHKASYQGKIPRLAPSRPIGQLPRTGQLADAIGVDLGSPCS